MKAGIELIKHSDLAASPFARRSLPLDVAVALLGALIAWAMFA